MSLDDVEANGMFVFLNIVHNHSKVDTMISPSQKMRTTMKTRRRKVMVKTMSTRMTVTMRATKTTVTIKTTEIMKAKVTMKMMCRGQKDAF